MHYAFDSGFGSTIPHLVSLPDDGCIVGSIKIQIFSRATSDVYREVHWAQDIPDVKEFFKNIHSLLTKF